MNNIHHYVNLHNDMSLDNIILHFSPNFLDKLHRHLQLGRGWNFNDLKESSYIHKKEEAKSRIMQHRWWVVLELNFVLLSFGSTKDVQFKKQLKLTLKNKTFAVDKFTKAIYSGNFLLAYYSRFVKEDMADDMYSHISMNQIFEVGLDQLSKEDLEQRAFLTQIMNWFMDTPFNWPVLNIGNTL